MATHTEVIEMLTNEPQQAVLKDGPRTSQENTWSGHMLSNLPGPGSNNVAEARQRWNSPRSNICKLLAVYFSFINFGMNDGVYGAIVPYVCVYKYIYSRIIADIYSN